MKTDSLILNIAIPTFNRADRLKAQLERLLPQLTPEIQLSIYDNASTDQTPEVVKNFNHPDLAYSRSRNNTGGHHNFLRCYEGCQAEWLWILSDDDPITPTAVADLLKLVKNSPYDLICTSTPSWKHFSDMVIDNIAQLNPNEIDAFGWISTSIYRMPVFHPLIWHFNTSMSSPEPHVVMMLKLLETKSGKILLSTTQLIGEIFGAAPRWSTLDFLNMSSQLPAHLHDPHNQKLLAQRVFNNFYSWALIMGKREVKDDAGVRRWQRIQKVVKYTLKSYGAQNPVLDVLFPRVWDQSRGPKKPLNKRLKQLKYTVYFYTFVTILGLTPRRWFLQVFKWIPKPKSGHERMFPEDASETLNVC